MDTPRVYLNLKASRTPRAKRVPPPSLHPDACRCPRSHRLALKLGCAGLVVLVLTLIGLSILVRVLIQKPSIENCSVCIQENRNGPTERPAKLKCPTDWRPHRDKCLHFSQASNSWKEGLADCASKEATLLLIGDQEELRFVVDEENGTLLWIGLNYTLSERRWKWINGSTLNSDVLKISGEAKENSCAIISSGKVVSENCHSDNQWICQKESKYV